MREQYQEIAGVVLVLLLVLTPLFALHLSFALLIPGAPGGGYSEVKEELEKSSASPPDNPSEALSMILRTTVDSTWAVLLLIALFPPLAVPVYVISKRLKQKLEANDE
jgi:hypothetical protein